MTSGEYTTALIVAVPAAGDPVNALVESEDPHCTLCYFGETDDIPPLLINSLIASAEAVASVTAPFTAKVNGTATLGDEGAQVLLLESAELVELYELLQAHAPVKVGLATTDQYPAQVYHLTLGYGDDSLLESVPQEVSFGSLGLWWAGEKITFPFTGSVDTEDEDEDEDDVVGDVDTVTLVDMDDDNDGIEPDEDEDEDETEEGADIDVKIKVDIDAGEDDDDDDDTDDDDDYLAALYAAAAFDSSLHPRGRDGKFIEKFGIIKWLKDGKWKYGRVDGISKGPGGKSDIDITVGPSDLNGKETGEPSVVLKPKQIISAPKAKAHVNIAHPNVKKVGGQKGSNAGGLYELPKPPSPGPAPEGAPQVSQTEKYYVKKAKSTDHGRNEALANDLYAAAGTPVPEVDYRPADGNIYSKIVPGQHDMTAQLNNPEWLDQVRRDFAVDAWLSNRDVFGLTNDNMLTDANGTPWRIDNGGALLYRAMGAKKTDFGGKVTELDVFRTGKKAAVYGEGMTKEQELDGAQRVLAIDPGQIDDMVADAGLPKSLADTLKARRKYLADYYGLPLPESVKPADTDLGATLAPLVDPADLSVGQGKSREWFGMPLSTVGFMAVTGDKVSVPGEDQTLTFGLDENGDILSLVGQQNQLNGWLQKYGGDAQVMFSKNEHVNLLPRPVHGGTVSAAGITNLKWQRGDRLVTENGTEFKVLGTNPATGGVLLQEAGGPDAKPAFLFDSYATKPTHSAFTVKRWDPPVPKAKSEPPTPAEPAKPSGMAVPASAAIKTDLSIPLPDGHGAPEPAKVETASTDKSMLLGDGTKANTGDTVTSKFGGSYVFVKKKGPYAVVTDPNSQTPDKELLKKANTLGQPGKEKSGEVKVPTSANGKIPAVGMHAVAKDGHEGEITMVSPDGKFVFITNAAGLKKRKSVGTVTLKNGDSPVPTPADEEKSATKQAKDAKEAADLQKLFDELSVGMPAAATTPPVDISESKPLKNYPDLKPGDKISKDGKTWYTVTGVSPSAVTTENPGAGQQTPPGLVWSKTLSNWSVNPALVPTKAPDEPKTPANELDLPGGYLPTPNEPIAKVEQPAPNPPLYFTQFGGQWVQLDENGPNLDESYTDQELFGQGSPPTLVNGEHEFAVKSAALNGPAFTELKPGDHWTDTNGSTVIVAGYPMPSNGDVMVPVTDGQGNVFGLYQSGFKPGSTLVTGNPNYKGNPDLSDQINEVYDNAWQTKTADDLTQVKGNAALSYLAMDQGIDPNGPVWLHYDAADESFWDLSTDTAQKWDKGTHTWSAQPNTPEGSKAPDIKNDLPAVEPGPGYLPEGTPITKHTWTGEDGTPHVAEQVSPGDWMIDGDPWTSYSDADLAGHGIDVNAPAAEPADPLADPAANFNGYSPHPGEQVVKLSNAFDGQSIETWWVQKPDQPGVWQGVTANGEISQHPMNQSDMNTLTTGTDNWTSEVVYGGPPPDIPGGDGQPPVVLQLEGGAGYAPADDETVIQLGQGTVLSSTNGQDWHEVDESTGQVYDQITWHSGDFADESVTVLHQGVPPSGEPKPEPIAPATPPVPDNVLPAGTDLPGGYQPAPGSALKHVSGGDENADIWFAQDANGNWQAIHDDGSLTTTSGYDEQDFGYWTDNTGATSEDFVAPGETPSPPVTGNFGGYQSQPGDLVAKVPQSQGFQLGGTEAAGVNSYWVKPASEDNWHLVTESGQLSQSEITKDESISWALNGGVEGTEIAQGTFITGQGSAVTPPATTIGGATAAVPVDINSWSTAGGGSLVPEVATAFAAMGNLPEGFTPYVFESTNKDWGHPYLQANTGQWYSVDENGVIFSAADPASLGIAVDKVQIGAPSKSPVDPLAGHLEITGWQQYGLPDPAGMAQMEPDVPVSIPSGGQWAFIKTSDTGGFYAHLTPGEYPAGEKIPFDQISSVGSSTGGGEGVGAPSAWTLPGGLDTTNTDWSYWMSGPGGGGGGATPATVPTPPTEISTKSAPKVTPPPLYPGETLPTADEITSWGGDLTKDGHIPSVGMYVKRASMTKAKILSYSADKTKVTVLTQDGKKSTRLISLLTVDAGANYQEYAPKAAPLDIAAGVPISIDPPGDALKKTLADGKWRPVAVNTKGIRNGSVIVTSTSTPGGKKVARVQLTLTKDQREALVAKLGVGGTGPAEKGDWAPVSKQSQDVAIGDKLPMRKSSQANPDGSVRWKVDPDTKPPTHEVVSVTPGPNGTQVVTMKDLATGDQIKSSFHPDKTLTTYAWDPNKAKPKPPGGEWVGTIAAAQGWKKTDSGDYVLSKVEGGAVNGTLSVEPGKPVPSGSAAIGWKNGAGGVRKINPDGSIIEVLGVKATGTDSANGTVVITLPANLGEAALNKALADLGLDPNPMTQESGKDAARGMIKNLLSLDLTDPDSAAGWTDTKIFSEMGKQVGIPDVGWQDVLIGSEDDGKINYYWSPRVQAAIAGKTKFGVVVRGGTNASPQAIASQLTFGQANGILKRTAGMQGGHGISASSDAGNNAAHGSYASALNKSTSKLPGSNPLFGKGSGFMVYINPMAIMGRIQDWRTGPSTGDAFGQGPNYHKGASSGGNSLNGALTQNQSQDFWLGGGFGPETIGFLAVNSEADRTKAIAEMKKQGITAVGGRPVEEIVITKSAAGKLGPKDIPLPKMPANALPITSLPADYAPAAGAVAGAQMESAA